MEVAAYAGIGRPASKGEVISHVLQGFSKKEREEIEQAIVVDETIDQTHEIDRADITKVVAQQTHVEVANEKV